MRDVEAEEDVEGDPGGDGGPAAKGGCAAVLFVDVGAVVGVVGVD